MLFGLTLFLSALLLFLVQPLIAQMTLPLLGGTPAVWNTCIVFFQGILLAGYLYAHFLSMRLDIRQQVLVHTALLVAPAFFLPLAVVRDRMPILDNPILALFGLLFVTVGIPFFVVSTSAPLLQRWFARTEDAAAADPYWLYSVSNSGSLIALLSYPFLIEPRLRLAEQSWVWTMGYAVLVMLTALCGAAVWRSRACDKVIATPDSASIIVSFGQRLNWAALAFIPSSLLLGVTARITEDLGSFPFLWMLPLALYLLSFILVFSRVAPAAQRFMTAALPFAPLLLAFIRLSEVTLDIAWMIGSHLATFFVAAMVCHGELARTRPAPVRLTDFYLSMSLGGMVGGLFNLLLAPLIFKSVLEYPLLLAAACLLLPGVDVNAAKPWYRWLVRIGHATVGLTALGFLLFVGALLGNVMAAMGVGPFVAEALAKLGHWVSCMVLNLSRLGISLGGAAMLLMFALCAGGVWYIFCKREGRRQRGLDVALVLGIAIAASGLIILRPILFNAPTNRDRHVQSYAGSGLLVAGLIVVLCLSFRPRPVRFALGVVAIFLADSFCEYLQWQVLHRERSYFGVLSVEFNARENSHRLYHGTTLHGKQFLDPEQQRLPLAYYHRNGPIGQVFEAFASTGVRPRVAIIGLGAGSLACYAEPGQQMVFYELDPAVLRLAHNREFFTYLSDAETRGANLDYVLGDARLEIADAPHKAYDLLVVDAFSSDAIPRHLMTREALELYLRKLADSAVIAFHITSRYVDLEPVLYALAQDAKLHGLIQDDGEDERIGKMASTWVLLTRESRQYAPLLERYRHRWLPLKGRPGVGVWSDDFSNLLSVLK